MQISQAQKQVDEWIKTIGVRYFNELTNTAILMEEVGELVQIMARKYGEQSFKVNEKSLNLTTAFEKTWQKPVVMLPEIWRVRS